MLALLNPINNKLIKYVVKRRMHSRARHRLEFGAWLCVDRPEMANLLEEARRRRR